MSHYWDGLVSNRVTRRRAIGVTGLGLASAAFLAACGGSSDKSSDSGKTSKASALAKPADTTKTAVAGGNFSARIANEETYYLYDSNFNGSGNPGIAGWVYSHIVKGKLGTVDALPNGSVEGDFAESFEVSPDGLTATFKVRQGQKWDARAPTNGRLADADDLKWSWDHWATGNSRRSLLINSVNPDVPVTSWSNPDKSTFVVKLAFPYGPMMTLLAVNPFPLVMPVEAANFDTRNTSRGSGAWISDEHQTGNFIRMKRNPDWYEKPRPFLDTYTLHVVPDYAAALSQLKSGALDNIVLNQEDVLPTKKDIPSLVLTKNYQWRNNPGAWIFFGFRPDSPFRDDRVRKAVSTLMDRDTWLDVFSNRQPFEAAGLQVDTSWYDFLGKGYPDFYLDPKKGELGDASKYFKFDPAEAKKLMTAAGFTSAVKATWNVPDVNQGNQPETLRGQISEGGLFDLSKVQVLQYTPTFNSQIRESKGNFEGIGYVGWGNNADPDHTIGGIFAPNAAPNWQIGLGEDKKLTELVLAQARATDRAKRADILKDTQKYLASNMYCMPAPGDFLTYNLYQPWIQNFDYLVPSIVDPADANTSNLNFTYRWFDKTKKPA